MWKFYRRAAGVLALLALALLSLTLWPGGDASPASGPAVLPAAAENWGLSFPTPGEAPVGNASPEELAAYDAHFLGDTGEKVIYLTFDCGYENGCTGRILDALARHRAPAAFFLVGNMVQSAPELVRRMDREGHILGNHTLSHPDMSKIEDREAFRRELEGLEALVRETVGRAPDRFYRPPQGKYSAENLRMAQAEGYTTVFWSLAYVDWLREDQPTREEAFRKLLPRIHPGAVVLLHSTSETNAAILDQLLSRWEDMGYRFAPLTELKATPGSGRD